MAGGESTVGPGARGLHFTLSMPGLAPFGVALSRFGNQVADYTPFWNEYFRPWWRDLMLKQFRSAGAETGTRWAPLAFRTQRQKARQGMAHQGILVRFGSLSASLINPEADKQAGIWRPAAKSLVVGTSRPYGIFHQRRTRRMPARPILRLGQAQVVPLGKLLQGFVVRAWQQAKREASASTT